MLNEEVKLQMFMFLGSHQYPSQPKVIAIHVTRIIHKYFGSLMHLCTHPQKKCFESYGIWDLGIFFKRLYSAFDSCGKAYNCNTFDPPMDKNTKWVLVIQMPSYI